MKRSTTNRLLTNTLRTLCGVAALTACSTWASVAPWQLNPISTATKDLTGPVVTSTALGFENTAAADSANQLVFKTTPQSEDVSATIAALLGTLKSKPQNRSFEDQLESSSTLSQGDSQTSSSAQLPDDAFAGFNTAPAAPQHGGAVAAAFDEEFVSVPNIQFAATAAAAPGAKDVTVTSSSVTAVPEMSALFPILGLIAAVSCTQILRRRRVAQNTAPIV